MGFNRFANGAIGVLALCLLSCGAPGVTDEALEPVMSRAEKLASGGCVAVTQSNRTYQYCKEVSSWQSAVAFCDSLDLALASVDSATENTFLRNQLTSDAWIGASDIGTETHWLWQETGAKFWQGGSTGTAFAYANWTSGRPANDTAKDCARFVDSTGKWTDVACNTQLGFVCEPLAGAAPTPNPPPVGQTHFIVMEVPEPLAVTDVAISGSSKVDIGHEAEVRDQLAGHAVVASLGDPFVSGAPTYAIEVNGDTGDVISLGRIQLEDDAVVHGNVVAGRNVSIDSDAEVSGTTTQNATVAFNSVIRPVTFPANPGSDVDVHAWTPVTLNPGAYREIEVHVNAHLTLNPGTYYLDSFDVEAGSTVTLKNSVDPVIIYIRSNFEYDGTFVEEAGLENEGNALVGYFGSGTVYIDEPFAGTLVAPKAKLYLDDETLPHVGAFFAREVELDGHATVIHAPFKGWLIPSVTVSDTTPCKNQPVLFEVDVDGLAADESVEVVIDGVRGDHRQLQFIHDGKYAVQISAYQGKLASSRVVEIDVQECAAQQFARVVTTSSPYAPYEVEFAVVNAAELTGPNRKFIWAFGDGTSVTTDYPFITHSYESSLDAQTVDMTFDATLTLTRTGLPNLVTPKTISMVNIYALNRARGYASPPITITQDLEQISKFLSGTYRIGNLEPGPLSLTSQVIERHFCDPDLDPIQGTATAVSLTVPANGSLEQDVHFATADYGTNVCGISLYLSGTTGGGLPVRVAVHFKAPRDSIFTVPVTDNEVLDLLNDVAATGLVADPNHITGEELERLQQQGRIGFVPTTEDIDNGALQEFEDVVGERCSPEDEPPMGGISCQPTQEWTVAPPFVRNALKGDLIIVAACGEIGQLLRNVTPRQLYSHEAIMTRNYYALAHSTGDKDRIVETVADDELGDIIDEEVLKFTWPGSVSASVAAGFRDGLPMVDPDGKLRRVRGFAAPATICEGDGASNPPLVIRPAPGAPPSVRAKLHEAADFAENAQAHYRWFGYTRSNIAFDGDDNWDGGDYRSTASWSEDQPATVSTTFIWWSLKSVGITLEGPTLEPGDLIDRFKAELPVGEGIIDGLYLYSESERRDAGRYLFNATKNGVLDKQENATGPLSFLIELTTGQATEIAAQFSNCFSIDDCGAPYIPNPDYPECMETGGGRDGTCFPTILNLSYLNPGIGVAVSPDDFMLWDAPDTGGVYGNVEPVRYRSADYVRIHRWVEVEGTGRVEGHVELEDGTPVEGVNVVIAGQDMFSQVGGAFAFRGLDAGEHVISADALIGGEPLEASEVVTVVDGGTTEVVLVLKPEMAIPPPTLEVFPRTLTFTGTAHVVDHENLGANEIGNFEIEGTCVVSPFERDQTVVVKGVRITDSDEQIDEDDIEITSEGDLCVGLELRIHITAICTLDEDNETVRVVTRAELFEFDGCSTTEKNGDLATDPVDVPPGSGYFANITVVNEDDDGDYAEIHVDTINAQSPDSIELPNVQPNNLRIVTIAGTVHIKDSDWPDPDDITTLPFNAECLVDPFDLEAVQSWSGCIDEVNIKVRIECALSPEDFESVNVEWEVTMFEGITCLSDDQDGKQERAFFISPGETEDVEFAVKNTDEDADDKGTISVTIVNEQRP